MVNPIIGSQRGGFFNTQAVSQPQSLTDYSPETQAELARQERRRQIANLLLQQGLAGGPSGEMVGRFYVPRGWAQGAADLAKVAAGAYGNYAADKAGKEAIAGENAAYEKAIRDYQTKTAGTPAIPPTGGETPKAMMGVPAQPVSSQDKQKAILETLLQSRIPAAQRYGLMQQGSLEHQMTREDTQAEARQRAKEAADLKRELEAKSEANRLEIAKLAAGSHEKVAELPVQPVTVMKNGVPTEVDARTGRVIGPSAKPELEAAKREGKPLSPTAQKELFEADDTVNASQNAKTALTRALELNTKAYEGALAGPRAAVISNIPGAPKEGANAAVDLNNIVTGQALEQLRATFGGMPTEGERKVLLDVQGSVNMTAPQRKEIWERAIKMVERREKLAKERADQLREGTYFKPAGGPTVPAVDLTQQRRASDKAPRMRFDSQGNPIP